MAFSPTSCSLQRLQELGEEILLRYEFLLCEEKNGYAKSRITYHGTVYELSLDEVIEESEKDFLLSLSEQLVRLLIESYVLRAYAEDREELSRPQFIEAIKRFFDEKARAELYELAHRDDEAWQKPLHEFRMNFLH